MAILDLESLRRILSPATVVRVGGLGLLTAAIMGLLRAHSEDVQLVEKLKNIRKKRRMPKDIGFKYTEDEANDLSKEGSFLVPTEAEITSLERPIVEFLKNNPLLTGIAIFGLPPLIGYTYLKTISAARSRYAAKREEEARERLRKFKEELLKRDDEEENQPIVKKSSVKVAQMGLFSKVVGLLLGLSLLYAGSAWLAAKKKQKEKSFDIEEALSTRSVLAPLGTNVPIEITPDELSLLRTSLKKTEAV